MTARLAAEIWVGALIRRVEISGGAAYVARRGADQSGAVALKLVAPGQPFGAVQARALMRATLGDGAAGWSWLVGPAPEEEAEVTRRLARQAEFDPDLWIVEIEDREPTRHLDDPIA